ncbi:MAG: PTS sugar transporter subunit IIC [Atopobiaceae bacterium]|nr:PTS sugar transporter subunit IIC [Atopobiaceae bacterium]
MSEEVAESKPSFLDKFAEISGRIGSEVHLRSLRDAFATIMPLYILAGIAVLINNVVFPLFLADDALTNAQYWGNALTLGTLNISAILLAGVVGYCHAHNMRYERDIACVVIAISAFFVTMPQSVEVVIDDITGMATGVFSTANTGTGGLFGAIIIGLLATTLFIRLSKVEKLKINLGEGVPPAVAGSFNIMIPMLLTLSIFGLLSAILFVGFHTDLATLIKLFVQTPLQSLNSNIWGVVIIYTFANLLFCLGIHQSAISGVLAEPMLTILITDNMAAYAAGGLAAIQPDHYMNMQIVNTFGLIGGSGCTLCLLIATFLFSKNKTSKTIASLAAGPGIFNINEPVIYGYPIVYNLPLMVPFVLVPDLFMIITYFATTAGLINPCVVMVPWTTPVFLSGFLATAGDFRAVILQVILVVLGVLIYLPFMKVHERVQEQQALEAEATEA